MQIVAAFTGGFTVQASWLGLRLCSYPELGLHIHQTNWVNSNNAFAM